MPLILLGLLGGGALLGGTGYVIDKVNDSVRLALPVIVVAGVAWYVFKVAK